MFILNYYHNINSIIDTYFDFLFNICISIKKNNTGLKEKLKLIYILILAQIFN